jgi:hypothetical protein
MTRCGEGEVSAESIGQAAFPGAAPPRDAKPTHPGAGWSTVDQNWAKLGQNLAERSVGSKCGEIGEAKRKFQLKEAICV